jgi:hypothetical protein
MASAASDWIDWPGGEMPVSGATSVVVRFGDEGEWPGHADVFDWKHEGNGDDITSYRVVSA